MPGGQSPEQLRTHAIGALLTATGPKPRVAVAFSGGLDSTALAHMLVARRRQLGGLRLIYVDHGLQAASREWSRHCARQARAWRVPLVVREARVVVQRGDSPEAAARDARYAQLREALQPGEVLVTAQHLDDQAETFLLQLFRGAGVAGLAAMPPRARFFQGWIARPLLDHSRLEIENYARHHRLEWVEDPSNQSEQFGRNFLRLRVMPLLREKWPGVDQTIARAARHVADAHALLDATANRDLLSAADGDGLDVAALRRLPADRRRNALRTFIARAGVELPSTVQLKEISGSLLTARPDAQPRVDWSGGSVRRRGGRLELQVKSRPAHAPRLETPSKSWTKSWTKSWNWRDHREFILNDAGDMLALVDDAAGAIDLDKLPRVVELRARQGGETLRPGPRARTQALKKLLQAAKLTIEQRAALPLLFAGEGPKGRLKARLIAVGDRWLDASVSATVKSRRRARLVWRRRGND